jgi:phosphatidylglycerophosphatase C
MAQDRPGVPANSKAPIVAFDFDGTLTTHDSYTGFLKWRAGWARYALGLARLAPAGLAYLAHRDRGRIKAAATREFLRGVPRDRLDADAQAFAEAMSGGFLRPDAVATWKSWQDQGARVAIVSASPDFVVAPFARALGADTVIGTQLAFDAQDRATGDFATPNCRGLEKVGRLEAAFGPGVRLKAAYGDTAGDREMLAISETAGYRVFTGKP